MLKKLRNKKTARKVWIFLAFIIVPAFVLWGSGSLTRDKESIGSIGKIFGREVSVLEFQDSKEAVRTAAIIRFGDDFPEVSKILNIDAQALERLILLADAKRKGISATDKEVIDLIESYPFFQRGDKFDTSIYNEMLQYVFHIQPRIFEEQTRQNLIISKLYKSITKDVSVDDKDLHNEYGKLNQEISLFYLASYPADFAKNISPTDAELKDYFAKHSLDFKEPLSFNLQFIALDAEEAIKDALTRLKKKETLDKIAKDLNKEIKETGFFGQTDPVPGIGWSPEILNIAVSSKTGRTFAYSSPTKTEKNLYILKLKERKEAYIPEFEAAKDKIRGDFIRAKSEEMAKAKLEQAAGQENLDFNIAAKDLGLASGQTQNFKFGSYIEGIGASDIFWTKANELSEGKISGIISAPSGFYIIKVKSRTPFDETKFSSEKEEFKKKLLAQRQDEYFAKYVEELKRKSQ